MTDAMPAPSRLTMSCTLHDVHDPQSASASTTTSHFVSISRRRSAVGGELRDRRSGDTGRQTFVAPVGAAHELVAGNREQLHQLLAQALLAPARLTEACRVLGRHNEHRVEADRELRMRDRAESKGE